MTQFAKAYNLYYTEFSVLIFGGERLSQSETLEGVVQNIVFHSPESGFTVAEIAANDELVTVVGETLDLCEGEEIKAIGSYISHPTYGRQFKAEAFERILPASSSAILRYLSAGAIKGIGPVLASRLVAQFGDNTLMIMENDPSLLVKAKGISPQKAAAIAEEYKKIVGVRSVMAFLSAYNIPPSTSIAVYKRWGTLAR